MYEEPLTRETMIARLRATMEHDERIVGVVDYGSESEGRADQWSDIDIAVFIRDTDLPAFEGSWKTWAAQFGELLLAFPGIQDHPWTVYKAVPVPLQVDFAFHPASKLDIIATWPNSPLSREAMIWYDKTGGQLSNAVQQLVGRQLGPLDEAATFEKICGGFWYYLLFAYCKLQRGQHWFAREAFNAWAMGNLLALLKFEARAFERWQASSASWQLEQVITPQRLDQLDSCIPAAGSESLQHTLVHAALLGREVCTSIATARHWPWPEILAQELIEKTIPSKNPSKDATTAQ
ncbi:hypothetical protein KDA_62780 [Dictyobacter alpinus]|uniref:Uncharacterized protein n=1 Tax=Dictyobacter alpinus TaxID=2014873 RepID=A0A402BHA0_9CHLR|nr:nucleotidyltransferase domain-containing protein [Dictyobacter alpinus]GCE30794.1 hypothetical protein KDA_62780 [Dictyobacter alpinus]